MHYLGYKSPKQIPAILKAADLLLITYSLHYENVMYSSPLKLIEAMASGTPIITADLPGARHLLSEAEAYFYQPDNPVSLQAAIQAAIDYPGEARMKAQRAFMRVAEFDWQKRVAKIIAFSNQ